jgi:hypothetical protein
MKRLFVSTIVGCLLLASPTIAAAAPNPAGTGQPGVECNEDGLGAGPHGFSTDGFAVAEDRYAGSEDSASLAHANSDHAVSQYDVACYQLTQNGH